MKHAPAIIVVVLLIVLIALLAVRSYRPRQVLYVRLDDMSTVSLTTPYPGSDIDAVEMIRGGDTFGTAVEVFSSDIRDGADGNVNKHNDPADALGLPNHDPNGGGDFVALGGKGGYVVLKMSTDMRSGDILRITEIGAGTGGTAEPFDVSISASPVGPFEKLGTGAGVVEVTIP